MSAGVPGFADVRRSDLLLALAATVGVFVSAALLLTWARLAHRAALPAIDPGAATPIAVRPVADVAAGDGRARGAKTKAERPSPSVPRAWRRRDPEATDSAPATPVRRRTQRQRADQASTPDVPDQLPPPEDSAAALTDPSADPADPDAEAQTGAPADAEGPASSDGPGEGEGSEGEGSEGSDPLLDRAIAFYRARLVAHFAARFRVSGSGLTQAELGKHRVRVQIDLGDDLRIVDYRVLSSDHPAFDAAARATLDKLRGESLPPPPPNYPGAVQRQLTVTFTCAQDTCD